jgi:hypothetical protein
MNFDLVVAALWRAIDLLVRVLPEEHFALEGEILLLAASHLIHRISEGSAWLCLLPLLQLADDLEQ